MTLNSDIAAQVATTPEQRHRQLQNIAFNEYDAAVHEAVVEYRLQARARTLVTRQLQDAQRRILLRKMNIATARLGAQLARIEGPR